MAPRADRTALASEVTQALLLVATGLRDHLEKGYAALGLTPAAARALHLLDPDHPLPARDLADHLHCDRSNVTALVDRLEQAGYVERRTDPADRRVKALVVTDAGRSAQGDLERIFDGCAELLEGLSTAELATLRDQCDRITARIVQTAGWQPHPAVSNAVTRDHPSRSR